MAELLSDKKDEIPVYAGSEILGFTVNDMPPGIRIYTYCNGVHITPFTGPRTSGAVIADPITTDQLGYAEGYLYIPSTEGKYKFLTGELRITFGDSPDGIASCKYLSETILMNHGLSLADTEQGGTISLRTTEKFRTNVAGTSGEEDTSQARLDPLSQTFFVDSSRYPLGVYVTAVQLYIYKKDDKLPISIELRPMSNGKPSTTEYFSGSFSILAPSSIQAYDEATQQAYATVFYFEHPIYLKPGEYALCVLTKSDKYELISAKNGDGKTVKQPFAGRLFKPQNTGEWVGDENEDLTFSIRKAKFNTGTVTFEMQTKDMSTLEYTRMRLLSTEVNFGDTAYAEYQVQTKVAGGDKNDFVPINPGGMIVLPERNSVSDAGDIKFQVSLTTKNPDVSPMLDKQLFKSQIINPKVLPYSADLSNSELNPNNGTARARYISNIVSLQDGFDSTGIEVKVDVNRKIGTDIEVFARTLAREDRQSASGIKARRWTRLPLAEPTQKSFAGSSDSLYTQETYRVLEPGLTYTNTANVNSNVTVTGTFENFAHYQIKVVFYSSNPTYLPKIKNLVATSLL